MKEMINLLREDKIKLKKGYIRGLSFAWWLIRIGQCAVVCGALYLFYVMCWVLLG